MTPLSNDEARELAEKLSAIFYPAQAFGENPLTDAQMDAAARMAFKAVGEILEGRNLDSRFALEEVLQNLDSVEQELANLRKRVRERIDEIFSSK